MHALQTRQQHVLGVQTGYLRAGGSATGGSAPAGLSAADTIIVAEYQCLLQLLSAL